MHIGCGELISLNSVLRIAGEIWGTTAAPEYREPRAGNVQDSLADIRRARRLLGYDRAVAVPEGLERTIQAMHQAAGPIRGAK